VPEKTAEEKVVLKEKTKEVAASTNLLPVVAVEEEEDHLKRLQEVGEDHQTPIPEKEKEKKAAAEAAASKARSKEEGQKNNFQNNLV
jgi:hypothetical protein